MALYIAVLIGRGGQTVKAIGLEDERVCRLTHGEARTAEVFACVVVLAGCW